MSTNPKYDKKPACSSATQNVSQGVQNTFSNTNFVIQEDSKENNYEHNSSYIDTLLTSPIEWKNTDDVVRVTIKSMYELIKNQSLIIHEHEKLLQTKATKQELIGSLGTKASLSDMSRKFNSIETNIDSKVSSDSLAYLLDEKVNHKEFLELRSQFIKLGNSITSREDIELTLKRQLETEAKLHQNKFEEFEKSSIKERDIKQMLCDLASKSEMKELISNLASSKIDYEQFALEQNELASKIKEEIYIDINISLSKIGSDIDLMRSCFKTSDIQLDEVKRRVEKSELVVSETQNRLGCFHQDLNKLYEAQEDQDQELKRLVRLNGDYNFNYEETVGSEMSIDYRRFTKNDFVRMNERVETLDRDFDKLIENLKKEFSNLTATSESMNMNNNDQFRALNLRISSIEATSEISNSVEPEGLKEQIKIISGDIGFVNQRVAELESKAKEVVSSIGVICDSIEKLDTVKLNSDALDSKIGGINKSMIENLLFVTNEKMYKNVMKDVSDRLKDSLSTLREEFINSKNLLNSSITMKLDSKASTDELAQISSNLQILSESTSTNLLALSNNIKNSSSNFERVEDKLKRVAEDCEFIIAQIKEQYKQLKDELTDHTSSISKLLYDVDVAIKEIDDLKIAYNQKAEIDDVNKALTNIHDELDLKIPSSEFNASTDKLFLLNDSLLKEASTIKLVWRPEKKSVGLIVNWDSQLLNTTPDIYLFEKDKQTILVNPQGLYEIMVCFFMKDNERKPSFQVLINSEPVANSINYEEYSLFNVKNYVTDPNSLKNLTMPPLNIRLNEFFYLNERSRISVSFTGTPPQIGLLLIKKII